MDVDVVELGPRRVAGVHEVVPVSELTGFFGRAYEAAGAGVSGAGLPLGGPAFAVYRGEVGQSADVTAGFEVPAGAEAPEGLTVLDLPVGPAVTTVHQGSYEGLAQTYEQLMSWMATQGVRPSEVMWEEYLTDPDTEPDPAAWRTRIVWPTA